MSGLQPLAPTGMSERTISTPDTSIGLTEEDRRMLSVKFDGMHIRFRIAPGKMVNGGKPVLCYLDARLVGERLNMVDLNWGTVMRDLQIIKLEKPKIKDKWEDGEKTGTQEVPLYQASVECRLTVKGITRTDVGEAVDEEGSEKLVKTAYSDALKRAAVHFGVGAYLYEMPRLYVPKENVNYGSISDTGVQLLQTKYNEYASVLYDWQTTLFIEAAHRAGKDDEWVSETLPKINAWNFDGAIAKLQGEPADA